MKNFSELADQIPTLVQPILLHKDKELVNFYRFVNLVTVLARCSLTAFQRNDDILEVSIEFIIAYFQLILVFDTDCILIHFIKRTPIHLFQLTHATFFELILHLSKTRIISILIHFDFDKGVIKPIEVRIHAAYYKVERIVETAKFIKR